MRRKLAVLAIVCLSAIAASAQTPPTVDYDTFWKHDLQGRIRTFQQVSPENRAALVKEHIERWVEANKASLTTAQLEIMKANAAFVTADKYASPMTEERNKAIKDLEAKTLAVFSREQVRQAMTIYGEYIPKKS